MGAGLGIEQCITREQDVTLEQTMRKLLTEEMNKVQHLEQQLKAGEADKKRMQEKVTQAETAQQEAREEVCRIEAAIKNAQVEAQSQRKKAEQMLRDRLMPSQTPHRGMSATDGQSVHGDLVEWDCGARQVGSFGAHAGGNFIPGASAFSASSVRSKHGEEHPALHGGHAMPPRGLLGGHATNPAHAQLHQLSAHAHGRQNSVLNSLRPANSGYQLSADQMSVSSNHHGNNSASSEINVPAGVRNAKQQQTLLPAASTVASEQLMAPSEMHPATLTPSNANTMGDTFSHRAAQHDTNAYSVNNANNMSANATGGSGKIGGGLTLSQLEMLAQEEEEDCSEDEREEEDCSDDSSRSADDSPRQGDGPSPTASCNRGAQDAYNNTMPAYNNGAAYSINNVAGHLRGPLNRTADMPPPLAVNLSSHENSVDPSVCSNVSVHQHNGGVSQASVPRGASKMNYTQNFVATSYQAGGTLLMPQPTNGIYNQMSSTGEASTAAGQDFNKSTSIPTLDGAATAGAPRTANAVLLAGVSPEKEDEGQTHQAKQGPWSELLKDAANFMAASNSATTNGVA